MTPMQNELHRESYPSAEREERQAVLDAIKPVPKYYLLVAAWIAPLAPLLIFVVGLIAMNQHRNADTVTHQVIALFLLVLGIVAYCLGRVGVDRNGHRAKTLLRISLGLWVLLITSPVLAVVYVLLTWRPGC